MRTALVPGGVRGRGPSLPAGAGTAAPPGRDKRHGRGSSDRAAGVELPADTRPGDRLAVPMAGAHQLSMASGYNLAGRPPVVAVRDGLARLLVRRESRAVIRSRDVGL